MTYSFRKSTMALALGVGIVGLAPAAMAETVVDFTVAEYSSKTGPYFEEVADAFEKENPDININIEVVPWDTLLQRLTTDIAGGSAPDISIIGTRWLLDFASQGVAEPLDGYLTPEFKATFIDTFMAPGVIDGKTMGLPVAASARAMMVNMDLYEKAGVNAAQDLGRALRRCQEDRRRFPTPSPSACRARKSRPTPTSTMRCGPMAETS